MTNKQEIDDIKIFDKYPMIFPLTADELNEITHKINDLKNIIVRNKIAIFDDYGYDSGNFDEILVDHPILGNLEKNNLYLHSPLTSIMPLPLHEEQYTQGLGSIFNKNKTICRFFVQTIIDLLKLEITLGENPNFNSTYNVSTDSSEETKDDRKKIDNIISVETNKNKYVFVFEVKVKHILDNPLDYYVKFIKEKYKEFEPIFVIISPNYISTKSIKDNKGFDENEKVIWKKLKWQSILKKFNDYIVGEDILEDESRFFSDLWHEILKEGD